MKWPHQQSFNRAPRTPWKIDELTHGYLKKYDNLYFLVVEQAGHMVPMELRPLPLSFFFFFLFFLSLPLFFPLTSSLDSQPRAALEMLDKFLRGSL